jgi:hypothetical protein
MVIAAGFVVAIACICTPLSKAAFIEQINPDAQPATPGVAVAFDAGGANAIGWYYTPAQDYTLTGIYSVFRAMGGESDARNVTVQIQRDRPAAGGSVLREATFQVDRSAGGVNGGSFADLPLVAGQRYFVDFLGIRELGVNVGTWEVGPSGNRGAFGAVDNLGSYYRDDNGFAVERTNSWEFAIFGTVPVSATHPIMKFEGFVVPEPSTLILVLSGILGTVWRRRPK